MASRYNNAEGGTNGNTVTATDTGSGDQWSVATPGTGGTLAYDTTHAGHGTKAIKIATGGTATTSYTAWTGLGYATLFARVSAYFTAQPTASAILMRGMASTSQRFRVTVESTDGKIRLRDQANTQLAVSTNAAQNNAFLRVSLKVVSGTSAAWILSIYNSPDSTTATETLSGSAGNFLAGNFDEIRYGIGASTASVVAYWLDDMAVNDTVDPGPPTKTGTASGGLGPLTGSAASQRTVLASASGALGGLSGSAAGNRTVLATASGPLGALSGAAASKRTVLAAATAALGALAGSAAGRREVLATAIGPLGVLDASSVGLRTATGSASADLGALAGISASQREVLGIAEGPLGAFVADAVGVGTSGSPFVTRPNTGTITRPTSGLVTRPDTGIVTRP